VSPRRRATSNCMNMLRWWTKELVADPAQPFPGYGQGKAEQVEIERLRREVAKLRAERDDTPLYGRDLKETSIASAWHDVSFNTLLTPEATSYAETPCRGCGRFRACNGSQRCIFDAKERFGRNAAPDREWENSRKHLTMSWRDKPAAPARAQQ
jgi:hypothetical protein